MSPRKRNTQTVYLASYLGFSKEYFPYLRRIRAKIRGLGHKVLCPWERNNASPEEIKWAEAVPAEKEYRYSQIARTIGEKNTADIEISDIIFAVLDGSEPDSGTVAELGYGLGLGKKVYGLCTDIRGSGDFPGIPINLQVYYFIKRDGGQLFRSIDEINF